MRLIDSVVTVAILLVTTAPAGRTKVSNDDAAIQAVEQKHEEAFRTHNAHLMASLFTSDADLVNVAGSWWKGQAEIETQLSRLFATVFRNSTWTATEVSIRYLGSDVAIVHVKWQLAGAVTGGGKPAPPRQGIATQVLEKRGGVWKIAAFQNTNFPSDESTAASTTTNPN